MLHICLPYLCKGCIFLTSFDIDCELCYLWSISTNKVLISVNISIFYNCRIKSIYPQHHNSLPQLTQWGFDHPEVSPMHRFWLSVDFLLLILARTSHRYSMLHYTALTCLHFSNCFHIFGTIRWTLGLTVRVPITHTQNKTSIRYRQVTNYRKNMTITLGPYSKEIWWLSHVAISSVAYDETFLSWWERCLVDPEETRGHWGVSCIDVNTSICPSQWKKHLQFYSSFLRLSNRFVWIILNVEELWSRNVAQTHMR